MSKSLPFLKPNKFYRVKKVAASLSQKQRLPEIIPDSPDY